MSLDNVIAIAAAAGGNVALLVLGLAISIPLIVAGAALIMALLDRFPILVWAGCGAARLDRRRRHRHRSGFGGISSSTEFGAEGGDKDRIRRRRGRRRAGGGGRAACGGAPKQPAARDKVSAAKFGYKGDHEPDRPAACSQRGSAFPPARTIVRRPARSKSKCSTRAPSAACAAPRTTTTPPASSARRSRATPSACITQTA